MQYKSFKAIESLSTTTKVLLKLDNAGLMSKKKEHLAYEKLQALWKDLENQKDLNENIISKFDELTNLLTESILYVGDTSNLMLDPDLPTYYLMDNLLDNLPSNINRVKTIYGQLKSMDFPNISLEDQIIIGSFEIMLDQIDKAPTASNMQTVINDGASYNGAKTGVESLNPLFAKYAERIDQLINASENIIHLKQQDYNDFPKLAYNHINETFDFWQKSSEKLASMLGIRVDSLSGQRNYVILGCVLAFCIAFGFYAAVVKSITNPLLRMKEQMEDVANNNITMSIECTEQENEVGNMGRALEKLRNAVENNLLMQKMTSDYPVFKIDNSGKINFCNQAGTQCFKQIGMNTTELIGSQISYISSKLSDWTSGFNNTKENFYYETIQINNDYVKFKVYKLLNNNNSLDGAYINMEIITEIMRNEESVHLAQKEINGLIEQARQGNLATRIDSNKFTGFYKELAGSMNGLLDVVTKPLEICIATIKRLSKGDLTKKMHGNFQGMFAEMSDAMNSSFDNLSNMVRKINHSSSSVSLAATEISSGTTDLAQRTEKQAASIEEVNQTVQEVANSVRDNSETAKEASKLSNSTRVLAGKGGEAVNKTIESIRSIEDSSQKMVDIISVIDEIAFQTNLLALNAAVEAARAGDAGKGFAVVAQEVRALAGRSAAASREIKDLIANSVERVKSGVEIAENSGKDLKDIVESVLKLTELVGSIAGATAQQAENMESIRNEISQMDSMTQQNAALVEESTAAAMSMRDQAASLSDLIGFFVVNDDESHNFSKQDAA